MSCVEIDNQNHMFGGMGSRSLQPVRDDEEEPHENDEEEEEEELNENGMSSMVLIFDTLRLILLVT